MRIGLACRQDLEGGRTLRGSLETEAKFVCPEGLTEADVGRVLERLGFTIRWHEPQVQRDIYLDAPDGRLLKANASLRLRQIGSVGIGTFKLPGTTAGAVIERLEMEWDLSPAFADAGNVVVGHTLNPPPEVVTVLKELGVDDVAAVLRIVTVRRTGDMVRSGELRAEVALDETTFVGPRGEAGQRELELELKAGTLAELYATAEALRGELTLVPSTHSKFAAGMALVG